MISRNPCLTYDRPATLVLHKISINDKENQYFSEEICMTKENRIPEKNLYFARFYGRKSVFCPILWVKNLYILIKSV